MSRRRQSPDAMDARGKLLAGIREGLGISQFEMAARLNEAAQTLGLPAVYRDYHVSRNERGTISFEDAAVWLSVDKNPAHGWDWFVGVKIIKPEVAHPPTIVENAVVATVDPYSAEGRRAAGVPLRGKRDRAG